MEIEILFRWKRIDNGPWVYGFYYCRKWENTHWIRVQKDFHFIDYQIIPETLGQYIGITDKNGTKIFEGDIVNSDFGYGHPTCVVEFESIIYAKIECLVSDNIEVIGNIFDNSELIK